MHFASCVCARIRCHLAHIKRTHCVIRMRLRCHNTPITPTPPPKKVRSATQRDATYRTALHRTAKQRKPMPVDQCFGPQSLSLVVSVPWPVIWSRPGHPPLPSSHSQRNPTIQGEMGLPLFLDTQPGLDLASFDGLCSSGRWTADRGLHNLPCS